MLKDGLIKVNESEGITKVDIGVIEQLEVSLPSKRFNRFLQLNLNIEEQKLLSELIAAQKRIDNNI